MTAAQQGEVRLMINAAALHDLKWENGMEQFAEESFNEIGNNKKDSSTGLLSFMLAAAGYSSDLSSIYELMRKTPHDVTIFNCSCKCECNRDIHQTL